MKKLIIALVAFLLLIGVAVTEIVLTTDWFSRLEQMSGEVSRIGMVCVEYKKENELSLMQNNGENERAKAGLETSKSEIEKKIDELLSYWERHRFLLQSVINHTVVKSVEERLFSLKQQSKTEQWEDLTVTAEALVTYFGGLKDDTHPPLPNLL